MSGSGLKREIQSQMHQAMKAGDKVRLGALRLLTAAIKNREIEVRHELDDDEVREIAGREVKKRTESIEVFDAAGRTELADRERVERDVVSVYAPAQLSDEKVDSLIDEALAATGATSPKEMGKVMALVMPKVQGRADGKRVSAVVREKLNA